MCRDKIKNFSVDKLCRVYIAHTKNSGNNSDMFSFPPLQPLQGSCLKKKKGVGSRLCANFWPLARDFWIFFVVRFFFFFFFFFLQTGVSLLKPENLIFQSKGTLECFRTHM